MTDSQFTDYMHKLGAEELPETQQQSVYLDVPVWTVEIDGQACQFVEACDYYRLSRRYDSCSRLLYGAVVTCGMLTLLLIIVGLPR